MVSSEAHFATSESVLSGRRKVQEWRDGPARSNRCRAGSLLTTKGNVAKNPQLCPGYKKYRGDSVNNNGNDVELRRTAGSLSALNKTERSEVAVRRPCPPTRRSRRPGGAAWAPAPFSTGGAEWPSRREASGWRAGPGSVGVLAAVNAVGSHTQKSTPHGGRLLLVKRRTTYVRRS